MRHYTMPSTFIQDVFGWGSFEAQPVNGLLVEVVSSGTFKYWDVFQPLQEECFIPRLLKLRDDYDTKTEMTTRLFVFVPADGISLEDLRSAVERLLEQDGVQHKRPEN